MARGRRLRRIRRVVVYNTNQFAGVPGQEASVLALLHLEDVDAVLLVECYRIDAAKLARQVPGWCAFQDRSSEGTANVAILYRPDRCGHRRGAGYQLLVPKTPGHRLRPRSLAYVRFRGRLGLRGWALAVFHRTPERDSELWPLEDANVRTFGRRHPRALIGTDNNAPRPGQLQQLLAATGMTWFGHHIIGVLVRRLRVISVEALPRETSDHPPVLITFTL